MFKTKNKSGFSLVEILLAITIFAIFTIGITYLSLDTLDRDAKVVLNNEGLMYAQEALEATRNIRDKNYLALTNGDHGLDFADNSWSFDLAPELVDDFYDRTVTVSDVYRNEAGNIDSEGTVFDPDTKKIDVRVNWLQNGVIPREVTLTEYLSNWKGDDWIQTTCSDFGEELGEEPLEPTTPSITVCTMLLDDQGNIITGEDLAGTEFRISLEDEDNQEVSESVFQTPFVYTRRVIATSPNYDAYCITYDNLDEENYSYSQEVITNNESYFETPLYNDQFDVQIQSLSDFYQYNTPGNENANGSIDLGLAEKNRTLVVLNRYNTEIGDENPIRARGVYNDTEKTDIDSPPDDNCGIKLADVEQASSFQTSADVGKHCTAVDVDGNYAYVSVNDTSSGFQVINITNKDNPTIVGSKNVGGKGRSVLKDGNYAYVGVEKSNGGMAIVNVSNPSSLVTTSTINLGDYGNGAAVNNNYLYAAIDQVTNALKIYNVSNKSAPSLTKTLNLSDSIHAIITNGNYAYVGSYADHTGLRVLNISTPATTSQVASLNVNEEVNAIAIDGNIAYLGIQSSSNSLKIVNISNPISPVLISSLDVGGEIKDLVYTGSYVYAAVDSPQNGLAAVNVSNIYIPRLAYTLDVGGKGTGVDTDGNYVYVSTGTANRGLVIVGTTVAGIATNGTHLSEISDTGSADTNYNFIEWEAETPNGTSVKFQTRTANSEANIATATWVGPDGTDSTYYETTRTPIALAANRTGEQYFQYQAFINSDGTNTPVLDSVRINYTP